MSLGIGSAIGQYQLVERLGAGGMGEVYRALHTGINREVAIKLLRRSGRETNFMQRFRNEASIQSRLHHPNIVGLYDFVEHRGQLGIVMEYVAGPTLVERIRQMGELPAAEAVAIFRQLVGAIGHMHQHGIVHRDIKPHNIKLTQAGAVKLLDFGIATDVTADRLTEAGKLVGTLQYLAPEQLAGMRGEQQADIWSLGVLFYEMVTGRLPFSSRNVGELLQQINAGRFTAPETLNSALPAKVGEVIRRCLVKKPANRYADTRALAQDLDGLANAVAENSETRLLQTPLSIAEQLPLWLAGTAAAATVLAGLLMIPAGGLVPSSTPSTVTPPAAAATVSTRVTTGGPRSGRESVTRVALAPVTTEQPLAMSPDPGSGPASLPTALHASTQSSGKLAAKLAPVSVDVVAGRAAIWHNGEYIADTPWQFQAPVGNDVQVVLRQQGFLDYVVTFQVNEHSNVYSYTLEKAR